MEFAVAAVAVVIRRIAGEDLARACPRPKLSTGTTSCKVVSVLLRHTDGDSSGGTDSSILAIALSPCASSMQCTVLPRCGVSSSSSRRCSTKRARYFGAAFVVHVSQHTNTVRARKASACTVLRYSIMLRVASVESRLAPVVLRSFCYCGRRPVTRTLRIDRIAEAEMYFQRRTLA